MPPNFVALKVMPHRSGVPRGGSKPGMQWMRPSNSVDSMAECSGCDGRMRWTRSPNAVDAIAKSKPATGESTGCDGCMRWMRWSDPGLQPENPPDATLESRAATEPFTRCDGSIHAVPPPGQGLGHSKKKGTPPKSIVFSDPSGLSWRLAPTEPSAGRASTQFCSPSKVSSFLGAIRSFSVEGAPTIPGGSSRQTLSVDERTGSHRMKTRNETTQLDRNLAQPAKRARLHALLFGHATDPGVALTPIKWPEALGE